MFLYSLGLLLYKCVSRWSIILFVDHFGHMLTTDHNRCTKPTRTTTTMFYCTNSEWCHWPVFSWKSGRGSYSTMTKSDIVTWISSVQVNCWGDWGDERIMSCEMMIRIWINVSQKCEISLLEKWEWWRRWYSAVDAHRWLIDWLMKVYDLLRQACLAEQFPALHSSYNWAISHVCLQVKDPSFCAYVRVFT